MQGVTSSARVLSQCALTSLASLNFAAGFSSLFRCQGQQFTLDYSHNIVGQLQRNEESLQLQQLLHVLQPTDRHIDLVGERITT